MFENLLVGLNHSLFNRLTVCFLIECLSEFVWLVELFFFCLGKCLFVCLFACCFAFIFKHETL